MYHRMVDSTENNTAQVKVRSLGPDAEFAREVGDAIQTLGLTVSVEPVSRRELYTGGPGLQVFIQLAEHLGDDVVAGLVGVLLSKIRRPKKDRREGVRQVAILGPGGEVLRVVEVPAGDTAGAG